MNACSIVLYIITERWPGAKKYRDTYEAIKQSLLESVEESKYQPRRAIKGIYPDLLPSMARTEEGSTEVSRMVADMAGAPMPIDHDPATPFTALLQSHAAFETSSGTPNMAQDFPISMDFHHQAGFDDSLFSFDNLGVMNEFDAGDFDINRTAF